MTQKKLLLEAHIAVHCCTLVAVFAYIQVRGAAPTIVALLGLSLLPVAAADVLEYV